MKKNLKNIVIGVLILLVLSLIVINKKDNIIYDTKLKSENIEYNNTNIVAMNIQDSNNLSNYNESVNMPDPTKYVINSTKSYCTKGIQGSKDTNVEMKTENGNHIFNNLTKNDRCFLYFDLRPMTMPEILAKYTKDNSRSGEITAPFTESTPTTVYSKEDDDGTSYVFTGVNPNNWVKFGKYQKDVYYGYYSDTSGSYKSYSSLTECQSASSYNINCKVGISKGSDIYWRIIRFNGNGSMRLIYSGASSPETRGTETQIGESAFNSSSTNNMYVGLLYTSGEVHGTNQNSAILGETNSTDAMTLYGWYNNIKTTYGILIDSNVGFCSDRESFTDNNGTTAGGGTGTTDTYYGSFIRYVKGGYVQTNYTPTLKCKEASDLLKLPVGLITTDEYTLAGGGGDKSGYYNTTFWLHTGRSYWTMSPSHNLYSSAYVFDVHPSGYLGRYNVKLSCGVRPVINLKSTTTFESNGADGTASKPYVVKI